MPKKTTFTHKHALVAILFLVIAAMALRGPQHVATEPDMQDLTSIEPAAGAASLPVHLAQLAGQAQQAARHWQADAMLVGIELRSGNGFAPDFEFSSPAQREGLDVIGQGGKMITLPPGPNFDPAAIMLPAAYIDPQVAIAAAQAQGMPAKITSALLAQDPSGVPVWTLQADGPGAPQYRINALNGQPMPKAAGPTF